MPPRRPWTLGRGAWTAAVERLRRGDYAGPMEIAVLTPLVDHFETAWQELRILAALAESFLPPSEVRPLPLQHIAAFILEDLVDVYRDAAAEVVQLIADGDAWLGDPDPQDIQAGGERFDRYLVLLQMAGKSGNAGPLTDAIARTTAALQEWATDLVPIIVPIRDVLESVTFGTANGAPRSTLN
jgi:hypothetical protein